MINITSIGAIDIGSNAIRLQISNIEQFQNETTYKKVAWLRVPLRLGEDVFGEQKSISDQKRERFGEAMQGFAHIMKSFNVVRYKACATSAMREAANGAEVVQYIKELSGIQIDIIDGQLEADIIFASGLSEVMSSDTNYLFVDVGGGSTELTVYSNNKRIASRSFTIGTVRTLAGTVDKKVWGDMKKWLKFQTMNHAPSVVVGSGGNISKVQRMLSKKEKECMSYTEMKVLYDYIDSFSIEERIHTLKLNPHRADVIIPALKIFLTVMKCCKIDQVMVPKMGLVEGIIRTLHTEITQP